MAAGFLVLLVGSFFAYDTFLSSPSLEEQIYPIAREARITAIGAEGEPYLTWESRISGKMMSGTIDEFSDSGQRIRLLPYEVGDQIDLEITALKPLRYQLNTDTDRSSLASLADRVQSSLTDRYPNIEASRLRCMIDDACEGGHEGLAALVHVLRSIYDNTLPPASDARAYEILVQACR